MNHLSATLFQVVTVVAAISLGYEVVWQVPAPLSGVAQAVLAAGGVLTTVSAWLG